MSSINRERVRNITSTIWFTTEEMQCDGSYLKLCDRAFNKLTQVGSVLNSNFHNLFPRFVGSAEIVENEKGILYLKLTQTCPIDGIEDVAYWMLCVLR